MAAPTITAFQIDSVDGTTVTLSGNVSDETPETVQVQFSGALLGSTTPNALGDFTYTGPADSLGTISAIATDEELLDSAVANVELTSDVPAFSGLTVQYGSGTEVTISGQVVDENPENLTVYFYGVVEDTAVTDANGNFSLFVPDGVAMLGTVDLYVYDVWGQEGYDWVEITSEIPWFTPLNFSYGTHTEVTISGTVVDEDPSGLTVYFTGAVEGTAVTDANGDFELAVPDGVASLGTVYVTVYDAWGQEGTDSGEILGDNPPSIINFYTEVDGGGLLTVQGEVTDEDPVGLAVTITLTTRMNVYEVTTEIDASFFWQTQLGENEEGWLTAVAHDWWGLESDPVEEYVAYYIGGY